MRLRVIAVGTRMPAWVSEACADYVRRLRPTLQVTLSEIAPARRGGAGARAAGTTAQAIAAEGERLLAALAADDFAVALDERGRQLTSRELASWLSRRMHEGRDVAFLIGGPDGLAVPVLARSDFTWSLSRLTLPHALARLLLVEQLYRAHTLLAGHPYHRE
ncbi:MAG TPA: 23S rRNA (pseudouridine(1915)-N(3))-methyltransferase RlmH [Steroidobacteraceae bacterium]|nr:23S rRNA (pseudouridine(1915)-N(3))-methyltransferase RlmH [Steroidobacteraceae bacterium]